MISVIGRLRLELARQSGHGNWIGARRLAGVLYTRDVGMMTTRPAKNGVYLNLDTRAGIDGYLFLFGEYEGSLQERMSSHLKQGRLFVDVGANIGVHSCAMARRVGKKGLVIAVEPMPETARRLRQNISLNALENVVVIERVAGPRSGDAQMYPPLEERDLGLASLTFQEHLTEQPITIEMQRLDDVVSGVTDRPVAVLKIDVEDHELGVLQGASRILNLDKPIIFFEHRLGSHGDEVASARRLLLLEEYLRSNGYHVSDSIPTEYRNNRMMVAEPTSP